MNENPKGIGEKLVRDDSGKFLKGHPDLGAGRPLGSFSLTEMLRREIQKVPEGQKLSYAEAFLRKMLSKAINEGDHASQRLIMNYLEGLPKQPIDITSGGKPIPLLKGITDDTNNSSKEAPTTQEEN